jgi:ATP-dependent Clp protease protease subunit
MYAPRGMKQAPVAAGKHMKFAMDESEEEEDAIEEKIHRENNHIYFHSEVTRDSIFELTRLIRQAEEACVLTAMRYNLPEVPIYLHISSFGGSIFAAFTAIDVMRTCRVPIHTIIEGATASAGTLISVFGARRYITKTAYMLIHQLSAGCWGKMNEIEDEFQNLQELMRKIYKIYKRKTTIPKEELKELLVHDLWLNAKKSIEYGLVDEFWTQ